MESKSSSSSSTLQLERCVNDASDFQSRDRASGIDTGDAGAGGAGATGVAVAVLPSWLLLREYLMKYLIQAG